RFICLDFLLELSGPSGPQIEFPPQSRLACQWRATGQALEITWNSMTPAAGRSTNWSENSDHLRDRACNRLPSGQPLFASRLSSPYRTNNSLTARMTTFRLAPDCSPARRG